MSGAFESDYRDGDGRDTSLRASDAGRADKAINAACDAFDEEYEIAPGQLMVRNLREAMQAAIAAYLAAKEADGEVLAPVEATARMVVAGANERENGDMELHARKWRAMIAARPKNGEQ